MGSVIYEESEFRSLKVKQRPWAFSFVSKKEKDVVNLNLRRRVSPWWWIQNFLLALLRGAAWVSHWCCTVCVAHWYHADALELEESKIWNVVGFKYLFVLAYLDPDSKKQLTEKRIRARPSFKG
nr:DDT domain-containing protein PTM-like [Ipomoea batatas]